MVSIPFPEYATLTLLMFGAGSLMFSYWLGTLSGVNIRDVGDGNPGAYNLIIAAGPLLGTLGLVLDYAKGFVPLFLAAQHFDVSNLDPFPKALLYASPILGHAFSPFLRFRGGKAIAVSFGVWSAITTWQAPTLMGLVMTVGLVLSRMRRFARVRNTILIATPFVSLMSVAALVFFGKYGRFAYYVLAINLLVFAYRFFGRHGTARAPEPAHSR